ncbi:MAG: hypothetical protein GY860_17040 [Desulfobacteraceae bacterium]|nr:hypothetical protein [Desulfobacteraceae bacterium]
MSKSIHIPQEIPVKDLCSFINDFPALLWRIEILKARIEFLNENLDVAPGIDGTLFLKNITYRNEKLLPDDRHLLEAFMDRVKEGKNAATVFRVKNQDDAISWLKLTGTVNSMDPSYYYGYLLNIDDTVSVIKGVLDIDLELKLMIEDNNNPVFFFGYNQHDLVCANPRARQMFSIGEADFRHLFLEQFYCDSTKQALKTVLKKLPLSRKWRGKIVFQTVDKKKQVQADSIVRFMVHKGHQLIRVVLQDPRESKAVQAIVSDSTVKDIKCLETKISKMVDINKIMGTCLASPLVAGQYEAILFSDVQVRKNVVTVYGAGHPFDGMHQAEMFSYQGTIAEDINRYSLDTLVVDDTQDSIKPIDWALFVPRGIRSYFAMPFYSRGVLRTVLILCSTEPSRFAGKETDSFAGMLKILNNAVKAWRRNLRG